MVLGERDLRFERNLQGSRETYKVPEKQEETGRLWPRVRNQVADRVGGLKQRQIRKGEKSDFPEKRQKKSEADGTEMKTRVIPENELQRNTGERK